MSFLCAFDMRVYWKGLSIVVFFLYEVSSRGCKFQVSFLLLEFFFGVRLDPDISSKNYPLALLPCLINNNNWSFLRISQHTTVKPSKMHPWLGPSAFPGVETVKMLNGKQRIKAPCSKRLDQK